MKISISTAVLNSERWYPILDVIAVYVEEGLHQFDDANIARMLTSGWVRSREADLRDFVRMSVVRWSTDKYSGKNIVEIHEKCEIGGEFDEALKLTKLSPLDAVRFLALPFQVIVENEWYDGAFILWAARVAGFAKILDAYRAGRFVFRHAGGKDQIARSAQVFSSGVWPRADRKHSRALRQWLCAILDSDSRYPGHVPNDLILTETELHVNFVRQLQKRSIECYAPIQYVHACRPASGESVAALSRLNFAQRAHFPMKSGFQGDAGGASTKLEYMALQTIHPSQKALFNNLDELDWAFLASGFGKKLSEVFINEDFRPNLGQTSLLTGADAVELKAIAVQIYEQV